MFYVKGDGASLQEICDRTLNKPSGGRLEYKPVVSWVALTFQKFGGMHSTSPASPFQESHTYSEASFWIVVEDARASRGVEFLIPYMFIDDWVALAAGREIFGYPKEYATVTIPPIASPPSLFVVDALAVPSRKPGAAATNSRILQCVARIPDKAVELHPRGDFWPDVTDLIGAGGRLSSMSVLIQRFLGLRLDLVFLRQFRPLAGGAGADLQQVVAAAARPFTVHGLPHILLDYELRLPPLDSHPIARDLGLAQGGVVDVPLGFQLRADFTMQPGTVL
jgi:hypothetical protein